MHYLSFDAAWQLSKDRRRAAPGRRVPAAPAAPPVRPRPPVDDLPRPPSTGGLPPAA